jgi:esterase/lipase
MILHGTNDQIVPIESTKKIYGSLKVKKKYLQVNDYYHDIFKGDKVDLINKEIGDFLKKPKMFIKNEIKEI